MGTPEDDALHAGGALLVAVHDDVVLASEEPSQDFLNRRVVDLDANELARHLGPHHLEPYLAADLTEQHRKVHVPSLDRDQRSFIDDLRPHLGGLRHHRRQDKQGYGSGREAHCQA